MMQVAIVWALTVVAAANVWVAAIVASVMTAKEIAEKVVAGAAAVVELGVAGMGLPEKVAAATVTAVESADEMAAAVAAMAVVLTVAMAAAAAAAVTAVTLAATMGPVAVAGLAVAKHNWTAAAVPVRTVRGMHLFAAGISIFYSRQVQAARCP